MKPDLLEPHAVDLEASSQALVSWGRGGYTGARRDLREFKEWNPSGLSADGALLPDAATLRARASDLERNEPLASGALSTIVTNTVGWGLRPQPQPDFAALGLSLEQKPDGVYVIYVEPKSPAKLAHFQEGDKVEEFEDNPIKSITNFNQVHMNCTPGQKVTIVVRRGPRLLTIKVKLDK